MFTFTDFGVYTVLTVAVFSLVSGDVEEMDGTEKNTLKIFKNITLIHEVGMVLLEVSAQAGSTSCGPGAGEQGFALFRLARSPFCPLLMSNHTHLCGNFMSCNVIPLTLCSGCVWSL